MSRIEKLSIQGIRSFDPMVRQSIQFNTPLTLIVGYNGSGKTTIIECLKYATTGELPPNSKGGAFIHDPKLCDEREVLAQVKLRFSTPPNTSYVVTRSIQLTIKKSTRSQKTLEGSLITYHNGERTVATSKAIVLDEDVPIALGVSPAILDSVIFCHQDESLWPMSEPSALKKRFDEIFEAQKYTKAIDQLKVLRKKYAEKLLLAKQEEGHDKTNKEKAERCQSLMVERSQEIEKLRQEYEAKTVEKDQLDASCKEKRQQQQSFISIENNLSLKNNELGTRQRMVEELRDSIELLEETDQSLETTLEQYSDHIREYEDECSQNDQQYNELQKELTAADEDRTLKVREQGKHQSDKDKYERQLQTRIDLVHDSAQLHAIRGYEGKLDEAQVQSFSDRLRKLLNDKKRELEALERENAEEISSKDSAIAEMEARKLQLTQQRSAAKERIRAIENKIVLEQNRLNSIDVDESRRRLLQSELEEVEQRLRKANEELQAADFDTKIQQEQDHLRQLEIEADRLSLELRECTQMASERAELNYRKNDLVKKRKDLDSLMHQSSDGLSAILGASWEPSTLEREFQEALQAKAQSLEEVSRKRDNALQQLKQTQFALSTSRDKAKQNNEEIDRCKSVVRSALKEVDPDKDPITEELEARVSELEDDILSYEKDLTLFGNLDKYWRDCQKALNKHNKCLMCERVFVDDAGKSRLAKKIADMLTEDKRQEIQKDLDLAEAHLGKLKAVRAEFVTYKRLTSEKPEVDREIQAARAQEEEILRKVEALDQEVREEQEARQDMEFKGKNVAAVSRLSKEITESESQVDRITSQQVSTGNLKSTDEIQAAQETCTEETKAATNRLRKLQNDKTRMREAINTLGLDRSERQNKLSEAQRQLERTSDIQNQIQNLREDMGSQKETINTAEEEVESLEPKMVKAKSMRDDARDRARQREQKLAEDRNALSDSVRDLKMIDNDIQEYLESGGPSNLASNQRAIDTLTQAIRRKEKERDALAARTNKLKEDISNSDRRKRNISDNISYRKNLREIEAIKQDIGELESRVAIEDYDRLKQEVDRLQYQFEQVSHERSSIGGSMRTKDDELTRLIDEWDTDYKDAAEKFRETHIRVEATKAAIDDLKQYAEALDKAIMQYHALKMEEVNHIAGELWRSTYQGTDIDTILIRSDNESTTGRRSYNYRVCMVKQDVEMDMRGRCSAGQKVLASIIIRLALAESFGTNCGLIALDEPTTNLDRDNIKSLAESLHTIIRARQSQSNFQLIVITHDEEFLRHMRCSDFCDDFFRVSRDEKQKSVITKEPISRVL